MTYSLRTEHDLPKKPTESKEKSVPFKDTKDTTYSKPTTLPVVTEKKQERPKEEPEIDIPVLIEEEKDEEALLEERRRKRQELLDRLKKAEKPATPATPVTPAPSSPAISGVTPTITSISSLHVDSPAVSTPGSSDSLPGTPLEDRPLHRSFQPTKKSADEMAILKSKDNYESVTNGTDTEHDMSAVDYQEAAPSLPTPKATKEPEIDMFGDFEEDMFNLTEDSDLAPASKAVADAGAYNPTLVDNWDDAEGYYRKYYLCVFLKCRNWSCLLMYSFHFAI